MRSFLTASLLASTGMGSILLADAADANAGAGGNNQTPTPKRYMARAEHRYPADKRKEGEAAEVKFVIEAVDYKLAWQTGREVTRVGTNELEDTVKVFAENGKDAFELRPGRYTVKEVDSLQQRSAKTTPVTLDNLEAMAAQKGITIPKTLQGLIEELKANPGAATAASATNAQPEAATGS